jgi:hypothetical protein
MRHRAGIASSSAPTCSTVGGTISTRALRTDMTRSQLAHRAEVAMYRQAVRARARAELLARH